jgi:hypothetical protein
MNVSHLKYVKLCYQDIQDTQRQLLSKNVIEGKKAFTTEIFIGYNQVLTCLISNFGFKEWNLSPVYDPKKLEIEIHGFTNWMQYNYISHTSAAYTSALKNHLSKQTLESVKKDAHKSIVSLLDQQFYFVNHKVLNGIIRCSYQIAINNLYINRYLKFGTKAFAKE